MILVSLLAAVLQAAPAPAAYPVKDRDEGPCTVFAPVELTGGRHPVILWGNGTNTPIFAYAPMLRHWASQGFVVAAAKSGQAGSGVDFITCLDRLAAKDKDPAAPFYFGHLDLASVGASGHSQGARGALAAAAMDGRIIAVAPIQPPGAPPPPPRAALLLLSGGGDVTAPPERSQRPIFEAATSQVVWATLKGASHLLPANGAGPYQTVIADWFRWRLMGDAAAGRMFEGEACGLCRDRQWTVVHK